MKGPAFPPTPLFLLRTFSIACAHRPSGFCLFLSSLLMILSSLYYDKSTADVRLPGTLIVCTSLGLNPEGFRFRSFPFLDVVLSFTGRRPPPHPRLLLRSSFFSAVFT